MSRVSVIVPNYNHARFLRQRIESVLAQTYRDLDVLLMDDASTDDSRAILLEYTKDPRVRTLFNERNSGGVFRQWNRGLRETRGEYVWLAESDDYADPRLLATQVSLLERHPSAGLAVCDSHWVDEEGTLLPQDRPMITLAGGQPGGTLIPGGSFITRSMLMGCSIQNASAVVFRRRQAEAIGGADETFRLAGDWMFWVRLLEHSDCMAVGEPLNFFRHHRKSVRSQAVSRGYGASEVLRVVRYIVQRFPTSPEVRKELRGHLVPRVWSDVLLRRRVAGPRSRLRLLGQAFRFDPWILVGLVRFGVQRAAAHLRGS